MAAVPEIMDIVNIMDGSGSRETLRYQVDGLKPPNREALIVRSPDTVTRTCQLLILWNS
jgi:hypothetical protein